MRGIVLLVVVNALAITLGCSERTPGGETASSKKGATPGGQASAIKTVVHKFWESVREGDANKAVALLSPTAQKCIRENQYEFVPPASDTMSFQIGEVEIVDGDQAIVDSIWTDIDGDGNTYHEGMSLALRKVGGRWCIFGMAADMGPNQPPMVMDLESPEEFFGPQHSTPSKPASTTPREARQPTQDPFRQ
ncbi:MAG: nuclear transport factor 2 family protein [Pirellulales bacterium]|nr:nuclear transport factor 2 family protein [Pirellulales bacterium]